MVNEEIKSLFPHFELELLKEIEENGQFMDVPQGAEILKEGQYVKVIPIVSTGLIKVFTRHDDRELLLYYIEPGESCIMSFAASLRNEPSKIFAVTEEDSRALLLPVELVNRLTGEYPDINRLFFNLFNTRYKDLLETINEVLFDRMDKRLYDYLVEKCRIKDTNIISISHKRIANELGTVREVVSRVLKKLENEKKIKQSNDGIEIL